MGNHGRFTRALTGSVVSMALVGAAVSASAQTSAPAARQGQGAPRPAAKRTPWEVTFFGGFMGGSTPTGGDSQLPAAGTSFTTFNGLPTRAVSSWYFGDGAVFMNQVLAGAAVSTRITSLDPALAETGAKQKPGGTFGVRLGRPITSRLSAEFSLEFSTGHSEITDDARAAIDASVNSFSGAFAGYFSRVSAFGSVPNLTSTSTVEHNKTGSQLLVSGSVNFALARAGSLLPYVTVGAGSVSHRGDHPSVTIVGDYRFNSPTGAPFHETDTVTLEFRTGSGVVALFGGGVKKELSARSGFRADVRVSAGGGKTSTRLDATPVSVQGTPGSALAAVISPTIQISNQPVFRSSLSGAALSDFEAFKGSGSGMKVSATIGYFLRF
jgi:hypothetical protein